jgi:uncharacterized Tic20 family protein
LLFVGCFAIYYLYLGRPFYDQMAESDVEVKIGKPAAGMLYDQDGMPLMEYDKDARTWGMLCHLSALLFITGVPLLHILGPVAVWMLKKKDYPFVENQGKEAINFQITMTLGGLIAGVLTWVFIGWFLLAALIVANFVLIVMASISANKGEAYRYPFSLRLIK